MEADILALHEGEVEERDIGDPGHKIEVYPLKSLEHELTNLLSIELDARARQTEVVDVAMDQPNQEISHEGGSHEDEDRDVDFKECHGVGCQHPTSACS